MVVETVFPGPADEHATVSTRLVRFFFKKILKCFEVTAFMFILDC
jgi:hypothetical protein